MKIGVLELLVGGPPKKLSMSAVANYFVIKQYASIMPQAVSVWSRKRGHEVSYATYFGQCDAKGLLPDDLDMVFISAYTSASALAYALAKLYRAEGTRTILGGPHAKAFPSDSLRFFDIVVNDCDETLVADILDGAFEPGTVISSGRPLTGVPTVEERMPEIRRSSFTRDRRYISTTVPMLASVGCPYNCNFCIDWNNPYALLPLDQLESDLRYLARNLPGVRMSFHDPNFGVKFEEILSVQERMPEGPRNPYVAESSLSLLSEPRLKRMRDTGCCFMAPGVESWQSYSNKAGVGRVQGKQKVARVVEHFEMIHEYVPGLQANFMFGLDVDEGDEPVELTKEFASRAPFVWPVVNIPVPFGGTPLYDQYLQEGRVLTSMPLAFYYSPYLVTTLKNYDTADYYRKLIELNSHISSRKMMWRRLRTTSSKSMRFYMTLRGLGMARKMSDFRRISDVIGSDRQVRAFHEGESTSLPEFYHREYEKLLGPYASLVSREERIPVFELERVAVS